MSRYLIDTDWAIDYLKGIPQVVTRLQALADEGLMLSVISLAELYEGAYGASEPERHLQGVQRLIGFVPVIGLDDAICRTFGQFRCRLRQAGQLIDNFDLLIAATCVTYHLMLVTSNLRHYERLPELQLAEFIRPPRPQ